MLSLANIYALYFRLYISTIYLLKSIKNIIGNLTKDSEN